MALTKITSNVVKDDAVTSAKIVDGGIATADIATNAVTSAKIAQNSILTKHIDDGQVTTDQLGADAVTSAKIADDAISEEHLDVTVITSLSEVTAATGDLLMVADISDSNNLKKIPVSSILAGTHTGGVSTSSAVVSSAVGSLGGLNISASGTTSTTIEIGTNTSSNHYSYIDLVGDSTYTDYGLRLIRGNTGPNTNSDLLHKGTGDFSMTTNHAASIKFKTDGTLALELDSSQDATFSGTVTATNLLIDTDVIVTDSTNDRVGINKTSPATTLDVGGSIYFSSILRGTSDGSASSPTIQPGNDGDTGLYRPATNQIGFTTAGTNALTIDASQNATFAGDVLVGGSSGALKLLPTDASDTDPWILYQYTDNTLRYNFTGAGADEIIIKYPNATNGTTLLIDTEQQRVGINATGPLSKLHVHDTAGGAAGVDFPVTISGDRYQADYGTGVGFRPETLNSAYKTKTAILASGGGYGYNQADLHFCINSSNTITDEVSLSDAVMTLKKGGDVLIGKTDSAFSVAGIALRDDVADFIRSENPPINVNRLSNNGDQIRFHQAGALIGSIGSEGGDSLYIQSDGTGGGGLRFHNNGGIQPLRNGATIHNTIDLGTSTRAFKDFYAAGNIYIGGATGAWIDNNDAFVLSGRAGLRGFGHSALAISRYNSAANAGEDGPLIDFLHGGAGIGGIEIEEAPTGTRGLKFAPNGSLHLKTTKQHVYNTVSLNGTAGDTVGLGQFANNGRGWWVRVHANAHYSNHVSSQVWEFTQNAYVGENHNKWLQVPETVSSSYVTNENNIALDVYRDNVAGSTSTPIHLRFRQKSNTPGNGTVYYTIESMRDMTWSHTGRNVDGTTSGTWANTSTAMMNGAVGGYYPTRSKYEFPVSDGAFWTDNAVINTDNAKGLYISNKGTVGIGFDKHMHTTSNVAMAGSFDHGGTLHLAGDDSIFVQTSTYGSNSEFMHYVYNDYYKIFRNTGGSNQTALHINSSLVVAGDLNDTSDRNLKKNIVDLPDGSLAIISQLKPVTFDWKNTDKGSNTGFIAQDVKTVLPNDVSGTEYKESDELHESSEGLSINSTGIVAHLVKAVQELEKRVKELEG